LAGIAIVSYYRRSLPRFEQVRQWLQDGRIGEVRHLSWTLTKPPTDGDRSASPNWRTDPQIAGGGYFADFASHDLDRRFASGALGMGCWNFVADRREDRVDIIGSKGRIGFSVFDEYPVRLDADQQLSLQIANPEHIQWHHVLGMNAHIRGEVRHPAVAAQALKTDWVMDRILGRE
jgi:predicted dehydrogenase